MWESREQFEQFARESFELQRHIIRRLDKLLEQGNVIERKVDCVGTQVLVNQQALSDLITADQALDAQVIAVLEYIASVTTPGQVPDDTAQLQAVTTDVNARVQALIDGLKAAQAGGTTGTTAPAK